MKRSSTYSLFIFTVCLWGAVSGVFAQKVKKEKSSEAPAVLSELDSLKAEEAFTEGLKYSILEEHVKALAWFEKALKLSPDNSAVHYKISEAYASLGDADKALSNAEKAFKIDPSNKYYGLLLAGIYERKNRLDDALKVYKTIEERSPNAEEVYPVIAQILIYQTKYAEALEYLNKFQTIFGISEEVVRQKQQIYLRLNKIDEAVADMKALMEAYPDEPRYTLMLAELYFSNNRAAEAKNVADQLLKENPNNPYARIILSDIYKSEKQYDKAYEQLESAFKNPELGIETKVPMIMGLENLGRDAKVTEKALKLAKITVAVHPSSAQAYALYADLLSLTESPKEALEQYVKSVDLEPDNAEVWQRIVVSTATLNDTDALLKYSDKALEYFPNQTVFWYFKGVAHQIRKENKSGISALEESLRLTSENPSLKSEVYSRIGDMYHATGAYKKSDEAYEAALKEDAESAYAMNNYSYYLSVRGEKLERAKELSSKLVEKYPDNSTYLDTYGWVLYKMKDYKAALKYLEKAASDTESGVVLEHFGDALYMIGEKNKAFEQWEKAKKIGGAGEFIDKKIADKKLYE